MVPNLVGIFFPQLSFTQVDTWYLLCATLFQAEQKRTKLSYSRYWIFWQAIFDQLSFPNFSSDVFEIFYFYAKKFEILGIIFRQFGSSSQSLRFIKSFFAPLDICKLTIVPTILPHKRENLQGKFPASTMWATCSLCQVEQGAHFAIWLVVYSYMTTLWLQNRETSLFTRSETRSLSIWGLMNFLRIKNAPACQTLGWRNDQILVCLSCFTPMLWR